MKDYVYVDNAATTKLDDEAFSVMLPWLRDDYSNASQPYSYSRRSKRALAEARETIAECINAADEEILFTSGGTESDNWAIKSRIKEGKKNQKIITSEIEHHAVINSCKYMETLGATVHYIKPDSHGIVSGEALEHVIDHDTSKVSIMFSNNEIGTIEPISHLAQITHKYGAVFHTDAVQAVGHVAIDVKALDIDMLSASAHKFNGPKGIGFLYKKKDLELQPFINGGMQELGLRAGTENIAYIVGMAKALQNNCRELKKNENHILKLEKVLLDQLAQTELDWIRNGAENHIPGNISLSFRGVEGEMLMHRLDLMGICVSTGSACDSKNTEVSHVLKAIQLDDEYAVGTIRISLGKNNDMGDVERIVAAIKNIVL